MGGEGSAVLSSSSSNRRRVILQDIIILKAQFSIFRREIGSYNHVFVYLSQVVGTPLWNEEHTMLFDQLKAYGNELQRQYTNNSQSWIVNPHCPNCAKKKNSRVLGYNSHTLLL